MKTRGQKRINNAYRHTGTILFIQKQSEKVTRNGTLANEIDKGNDNVQMKSNLLSSNCRFIYTVALVPSMSRVSKRLPLISNKFLVSLSLNYRVKCVAIKNQTHTFKFCLLTDDSVRHSDGSEVCKY